MPRRDGALCGGAHHWARELERVRLRPPGVLQFRRTQHEARVMKLIERNGLINDRDDDRDYFAVVDAAE